MREKNIVFFDLDDTILDWDKAERRAISMTFEHFGIECTEAVLRRYSVINSSCWERLEKGEMARAEVLTRRFEILFGEMGVAQSGDEVQAYYENLICQGHFFLPGAEELLETLWKEYDLYLVSNGNARTQDSRLESAGISPYFQGIFISEKLGVQKPSKAFFDACIVEIPDYRPEQAVIIGDSLTSDIQGGINIGIKTVWFNYRGRSGREGIVPDVTVTSLGEIPAVLKKILPSCREGDTGNAFRPS